MNRLLYLGSFLLIFIAAKNLRASADSVAVDAGLNFSVQDIDGNEQSFASYLGKGPVLITFWAMWCDPKHELRVFKTLVEKFKDRGVTMIAINADKVKSLAKVRSFVKTQGIDVPVLIDPDGSIAQERFALETIPFSLILNPNGSVYKKHQGFCTGNESIVEKDIEELLQILKGK